MTGNIKSLPQITERLRDDLKEQPQETGSTFTGLIFEALGAALLAFMCLVILHNSHLHLTVTVPWKPLLTTLPQFWSPPHALDPGNKDTYLF